jgi:hypothetical protein
MKTIRKLLRSFALAATSIGAAGAAVPTINYTVDSFYLGSATTFSATVADADADMTTASFSVMLQGSGSGFTTLSPDVTVPTSGQTTGVNVSKSWTPTLPGLWTVRITVNSNNGSSSADRNFDVLAGTRTLNAFTVPNGSVQIYEYSGELVTQTVAPPGTSVVVESGGGLILWSGGRIKLEPGFKATAGPGPVSLFWAAVDHNMNGYSDSEEVTDTDHDGMPDAWEIDHGLNPLVNDAAGDLDGDGISNLAEYLNGTDPNNKADGAAMPGTPGTYDLVLKTPSSYYGLNKTSWALSSVNAP